jgi:hypothetical protein
VVGGYARGVWHIHVDPTLISVLSTLLFDYSAAAAAASANNQKIISDCRKDSQELNQDKTVLIVASPDPFLCVYRAHTQAARRFSSKILASAQAVPYQPPRPKTSKPLRSPLLGSPDSRSSMTMLFSPRLHRTTTARRLSLLLPTTTFQD